MDIDPLYELIEMSDQPRQVQEEYCVDCIIREIETLSIERRIDVVVAGLDMLCALAKDGKVNEYAAGQILTRAQLAASFVGLPQPGQLRIIRNG